jgi:hypothetical protein
MSWLKTGLFVTDYDVYDVTLLTDHTHVRVASTKERPTHFSLM